MKKNTLENMCVYYKDAEGLRFEKQEHIIPAFLGGKKMLDQGVVSDQANELFSGIEKHAAMESFINIDRMFLGPGKRGSRNPKKAGSAKISVMCSQNGRASLGYEKTVQSGVVVPRKRYLSSFANPPRQQNKYILLDKSLRKKDFGQFKLLCDRWRYL